MAELNRRPDRPDPSDDRPADGGDTGARAGRSWGRGRGGAGDSGRPTLREMFDAADRMAAEYDAGRRPPDHRAAGGPSGGDRTESRQESRESELTGLRERAAADRAELADPARDDQRSDGDDDGPREVHDAERGSDQDGTDEAAPPADRTPDGDPKEPAGADGNRGGDGPNNPPPPDGPDDGRDSPDELAAAKARIAELEKELDAAKAENEAKDATIGRLQNTCTYLDRGREAAETKAAEQSARVDALTGTVAELTSEIDTQREAADARAAAQEARIDQLTGTVAEQNAQIGALTGEVAELRTMFGDALKQMNRPEQSKTDTPGYEAGQIEKQSSGLDETPGDVPAEPAEDSMLSGIDGRTASGDVRGTRKDLPTSGYAKLYSSVAGSVLSTGGAAGAVMSFAADVPTHITPLAAAGGITGAAAAVGGAIMTAWGTVTTARQRRRGQDGD